MKRNFAAKVWMVLLVAALAMIFAPNVGADWYTSDGQRFATMKDAADHAWKLKDGTGFSDQGEALPIGDAVTLTVVYGNDARSQALKQAFKMNPLAPVRKQMSFEEYESGNAPDDWKLWSSKRELPAMIVQYNGQEVLVRSGREITDYQKLADELTLGYAECFHGRRHGGNPPPPDTGDDTPPPLPPVAPSPPDVGVSVGSNGAALALSSVGASFLLGGLFAGVLGWVKRTS